MQKVTPWQLLGVYAMYNTCSGHVALSCMHAVFSLDLKGKPSCRWMEYVNNAVSIKVRVVFLLDFH
jgi:hypothetical protein